ncbi:MAG: hypothetical protein HC833_11820 [Leptolyngbyaceae cyanobacterium RM1_406_9]|nr:hypothetical protein [Leptolyngbyaceae cyanobacterium RM1_406_9]
MAVLAGMVSCLRDGLELVHIVERVVERSPPKRWELMHSGRSPVLQVHRQVLRMKCDAPLIVIGSCVSKKLLTAAESFLTTAESFLTAAESFLTTAESFLTTAELFLTTAELFPVMSSSVLIASSPSLMISPLLAMVANRGN